MSKSFDTTKAKFNNFFFKVDTKMCDYTTVLEKLEVYTGRSLASFSHKSPALAEFYNVSAEHSQISVS